MWWCVGGGGGGGGLGDDDIGNGMEPSETGFTWRSSEGRTFLISLEHVTQAVCMRVETMTWDG